MSSKKKDFIKSILPILITNVRPTTMGISLHLVAVGFIKTSIGRVKNIEVPIIVM